MAKTLTDYARQAFLDLLGSTLVIAAFALGWIPGPGGIPLFIAGLSLLAINHEWAKRWLATFKEKGSNLMEIFFRDHKVIKAIYDMAGLLLVFVAIYLLNTYTRNLVQSLALAMGFAGLGLLIGNHKRLQRLNAWIRRQKH